MCSNKQQASKIAFDGSKRHRVVTTDGVVINTSGTMEGGGKPQRGRMSAQQAQGEVLSDKELAQLLARADKAAQQLEELRATRAGAQPEARAMQKPPTPTRTFTLTLTLTPTPTVTVTLTLALTQT